MDKSEFRQMCEAHGLRMVSDAKAVGMERGYFITLMLGGKNTVSFAVPTRKDLDKTVEKELKRILRERFGKDISAAWVTENVNTLTVFIDVRKIPDVYCQGVTAALDVLRGLGVGPVTNCTVCGQGSCDAAIPYGAAYAPVHRACLEKQLGGAKESADKNLATGSYLTGILGAIAGMLVGILPTLFTILAVQKIYVLTFMLIPMACYYGYMLCRGKMNLTALIVSVLLSAAGTFLLVFLAQLFAYKDAFELTLGQTLGLFIPAFRDRLFWKEVVSSDNMGMCLVFTALGIFLAWGVISKTGKTAVKTASLTISSAVPYAPVPDAFEYDPTDYLPDQAAPESEKEEDGEEEEEE